VCPPTPIHAHTHTHPHSPFQCKQDELEYLRAEMAAKDNELVAAATRTDDLAAQLVSLQQQAGGAGALGGDTTARLEAVTQELAAANKAAMSVETARAEVRHDAVWGDGSAAGHFVSFLEADTLLLSHTL
jgi:type VI protein secretion system component VasF